MPEDKVTTLSDFLACVRSIRADWRLPSHKELWFRGEGEEHKNSILRPALYRTVLIIGSLYWDPDDRSQPLICRPYSF